MRLVPGCALMLGLFAVSMPMDEPFAEEGIGQTNSDATGTKTAMARAAPSVTPASRKKAAEPPDTALATALAGWIAAEFGLPRMRKPPDFVIVPAKRLVALRFGEVASDRWAGGANAAVRAGDIVSIWPWLIHRHETLWDRPDEFDHRRFVGDARKALHRFQYIPFGGGPRTCVGARFAVAEALTILAHWLAGWRFLPAPGHDVAVSGMVTLRPKGGLPLILERR